MSRVDGDDSRCGRHVGQVYCQCKSLVEKVEIKCSVTLQHSGQV